MTYDFLYELENGCVGIHTIQNAKTEYEARDRVRQEKPEVLHALLEINEYAD